MKRRKIIGLALLIGTVVYLFALILALYQNQRVKMEKGIEEALKAYAQKDNLDVKELSKDFNLLLDEKIDTDYMNQQVLKYEGSFARMEKSVTNVTDEMALMEYNVKYLSQKIEQMENYYKLLQEEVTNMNTVYDANVIQINNTISEIKSDVEKMKTEILKLESIMTEKDGNQEDNIIELQKLVTECEGRLHNLENNVLYYQYDEESQTLKMYGHKEAGVESE